MVDRRACPAFHAAVELIGRRWNGVIIDALLQQPLRFSELRAAIPDITPAMLSQRLKELEADEVIIREVSGRPVEVSYELTDVGRGLSTVLDAVALWSIDWSGEGEVVHNSTATERNDRWNSASTRSAS
jgi:DNA-binding HxlR family transcriptional regulator